MPLQIRGPKQIGSTIKQFIFLMSLVAMAIVFVFLSVKNFVAEQLPAANTEEQLLNEIKQTVNLPSGAPSIEMLEETDLLRQVNPKVYGDAEEGDVILEYEEFIFIYRPSEKRLIQSVRK